MAGLLSFSHRYRKRAEPLFHQGRNPVSDWARQAIEPGGGSGKKAGAPEDAATCVVQPRVAERPKAGQSTGCHQPPTHDRINENLAGALDGGQLQLLFGAERSEKAALAHLQLAGQLTDGKALQPLCGSKMHCQVQDLTARALSALEAAIRVRVLASGSFPHGRLDSTVVQIAATQHTNKNEQR